MSHLRTVLLSCVALSAVSAIFAQGQAQVQVPSQAQAQAPAPPPLLLGTAWYPEQWPESRWEADLTLMQQAHMHVVRVGEFAWSTMEPSEGHFDFSWLDHAIALAGKHGIYTVLGTPTAAPPAWLTRRYPETLRVDENGHRDEHGNRQQFSPTDPRYREFCRQIAHEMAVRYGHNPYVLGWQIDNEISAPTFDPSAVTQWHAWLAKKYGTVAELNRLWTTAYWSQTYDSFDEVPFHSQDQNPALLLDYQHFMSDVWTAYVENQQSVIRPLATPSQFITTNTMGWFSAFDHYELHRNLDIAAWDDYFPDGHLDPLRNGELHDLVRGYKGKNFWLMETQPAFVNWGPINAALPPGGTREAAWQAIGHGADAVLYWQWRSALNGQEEYHGTLVGADGLPVPVYPEIAQLGTDMDRAGAALKGTTVTARVAILQDYDSHWAIGFQKHTRLFDYTSAVTEVYRAVRPVAQSVDVISPEADLSRYPVVFAPALNVLPEPLARHLLEYVRGGGHLVLTTRSGMKNEYNGLQPERQPGPLAEALGAHVGQFYALPEKPAAPVTVTGPLGSGNVRVWAETLVPTAPDTRTLLTYGPAPADASAGWLAGQAAAVSRAVGKGSLTYIGASLDQTLMNTVATRLLEEAGVHPILPGLPGDVELMQRAVPGDGPGHAPVSILINHGSDPQQVTVPAPMTDVLTGTRGQSFTLQPHGVAVLQSK